MAKETLLDLEIRAGAHLIRELDAQGFHISSALWLYDSDQEAWKLLLAAPQFSATSWRQAYEKVAETLHRHADIAEVLAMSDISVLTEGNPRFRLLKGIKATGPGIHNIRMGANLIDGIFVEDAIIYRNAA
jgi:hypothetical protein